MLGLPKLYAGIGIALLLIVTIGGLTLSRNHWKGRALKVEEAAGVVTATIRRVTNNPKLQWKDANEQIEALAVSRESWKTVAGEQTAAIDALGMEAERLRALNAELREKAKAEIAKRNRLIARLDNDALTPGDRDDCQAQIAAAEAALDAIFEEGL